MERSLAAAWVYDWRQHRQANAEGANYWDLYIGEICAQMGLTVDIMEPAQLAEPGTVARYSCLLVGGVEEAGLAAEARDVLSRWVERGGLLVGFSTQGLDGLLGVAGGGVAVAPAGNPFSQSAYLALRDHPLCQDLRPDLHPEQMLLAYGPARSVRLAADAEVLADLVDLDGRTYLGPAVTVRRLGEGWAAYFAFSLPQTVWVLHEGRPVDRDWDGDGYWRTGDLFVIGDNEIEVPYADHLVWLMESIVGLLPHPMIYALPLGEGVIPTALYYWAGDDEFVAGDQVKASNYVRSVGLPYHVNVMYKDGAFALSREEADVIRANGHDFSLHYNFVPDSGFRSGTEFTAADVREQADAFHAHFGVRPYANVNHWLRWVGYAEPARWMAEVGGKGDASFVHARMPPLDPNDIFGFPFGTSLPFRFYEDWRRGNERLEFVEKPLTGYEMGYSREATDFARLHRLMDLTHARHLMTSMFYHSNRIAGMPNCRAAIEGVLSYIAERGVRARHLSLNGLVRWWFDRLASSISAARLREQGMTLHVAAKSSEGLVMRMPLGQRRVATVSCDGMPATWEVWQERGQSWLMAAVPAGGHRLEVTWSMEER